MASSREINQGMADILGSLESAGVPTAYGQACTNCSRAKYRCIYRTAGRDCERCHRLRKECVPSSSVRRMTGKRGANSRSTPAHVKHLEDKIEELVRLLRTQQPEDSNPGVTNLDGVGVLTPASTTVPVDTPSSFRAVSISKSIDGGNATVVSHYDEPSLISCPQEPSPAQAESCLSTFRDQMLLFLPMVYLPPTMSAKQLRETSPFLWFNIMAVTARSTMQQSAMSDSIKRFLAQKLVVDNEKNLDMLLGLLVFMCWFHFHRGERSYISVMASLACSLVFDMRLNKALAEPAATPCGKVTLPQLHRVRTMAERRAVLSCFLLSSQAAYTQKKIDALEWTPHMDESLQMIAQYPEWQGDEQLATQVKVQLLNEQARRSAGKSLEDSTLLSFAGALQAQLEKLRTQLTKDLLQNNTIGNNILYTELVLQENTLAKLPTSVCNPNLQRHELLNSHLETIIRWFDRFFAIPINFYSFMTFAFWTYMAHGLMLLHRLYVLEDPAWDRGAVRARLDLFALCDRLAAILDDTGSRRIGRNHTEEDVFMKFAKMVRTMRNEWLSEVQALDLRSSPDQQRQTQTQNHWSSMVQDQGLDFDTGLATGYMPTTAVPMMTMSDDAWLQEFF